MRSAPAHLSFGLVEGRPVFMDEIADAYFLLGPAEEDEFLALRNGDSSHSSEKLRDALAIDPGRVELAQCARPHRSLSNSAILRRSGTLDALSVARILVQTKSSLSREPISSVLDGLRARPATRDGNAYHSSPEDAALAFLAARRLVPLRRNCLLDSIAMMHWLRRGSGAALVFGVKLHPFAAHCWLQSDELLLNDRLETVARFEPVRVIPCSPATR